MWPPKKKISRIVEWVKEWVPITQAIITLAALLVGGWWTYELFIEQREQYPHANIEQKLSYIAFSKRAKLLHVEIELTDTGKTLLTTGKAIIRVHQILPPVCQTPCPWPPCGAICADAQVDVALSKVKQESDRGPLKANASMMASMPRCPDSSCLWFSANIPRLAPG
jgi:hypothetical protein